MTTEYLVILPVGPIEPGVEYRGSLPLHCTVMPWFRLGEQVSEVILGNKLMFLACGTEELELVSERSELFGLHNDEPVHVLARNEQLNKMHTELLVFLAQIHSLPAHTEWLGANYQPHVSDSKGSSFPSSRRHKPKKLILLERNADKIKRFKESYQLGDIPF